MRSMDSMSFIAPDNRRHDEHGARGVRAMPTSISAQGAQWVAFVLVGMCAAFLVSLMHDVAQLLHIEKLRLVEHVRSRDGLGLALLTHMGFSVLFITAAFACVMIAPHARGSGLPGLIAYLNGVKISGFTSSRVLVCRLVGTSFSLAAGLCVGPEGPIIHIGGCIGKQMLRGLYYLGQSAKSLTSGGGGPSGLSGSSRDGGRRGGVGSEGERSRPTGPSQTAGSSNAAGSDQAAGSCHSTTPKSPSYARRLGEYVSALTSGVGRVVGQFAYMRNDLDQRDFVAIGAGAGIAVAFNAPISATLFVVEEASSHFSIALLWRAFTTAVVAVWASLWCHAGLFGIPQVDTIEIPDQQRKHQFQIKFEAGIGADCGFRDTIGLELMPLAVIGGLIGAAINEFIVRLQALRERYARGRGSRLYLEAVIVTVITSLVSVLVPEAFPCRPTSIGWLEFGAKSTNVSGSELRGSELLHTACMSAGK